MNFFLVAIITFLLAAVAYALQPIVGTAGVFAIGGLLGAILEDLWRDWL